MRERVVKTPWRPEHHGPASADGTDVTVAHAILERQLKRPPIDTNRIQHAQKLRPRERGKAHPGGHQSHTVAAGDKRGPLFQPTARNVVVDKDALADLK